MKLFEFDDGAGHIMLYFDQFVNPTTFNVSKMTLQSTQRYKAGITHVFQFQKSFNDLSTQVNATSISIYLGTTDYAKLKMLGKVGSSNTTTFLTLQTGAAISTYGHLSTHAINSSNAFAATTYTADLIPPYTKSYTLNMNHGILNMTFSEPLNNNTFQLKGLAFQSVSDNWAGTNAYIALVNQGANWSFVDAYNKKVSVKLGSVNLNLIKGAIVGNNHLCTLVSNTWLAPYQSFVNDLSGKTLHILILLYASLT